MRVRFGPHPSVIASRRAMARLAAVCYLTGGLVGFLTAWLVPAWEDRAAALAVSSVALIGGVLLVLCGERLSVRGFYGLVFATLALLALQMSSQRGHAEATAAALLLPLLSMFVHAFFDRRATLLADAGIVGLIALAQFAWSALPVAIAATLVCVNGVVAAVTGWLVRAAAEADIDLLTGLPNRRGLVRALRVKLAADRDGTPLTLALLDVEQLVDSAARRGPAAADDLLRGLGQTWSAEAGPAVVARYGDTTFAVLVTGGVTATTALLERLRAAASTAGGFPVGTAGHCAGDTSALLTGRAESALSEARRTGGSSTVHYEDTAGVASQLTAALTAGEFTVVYQPIVDAAEGRVTGAEALVRWIRPGLGPVPPNDFIPDAERSGFIRVLDRWVLRTACQAAASWPRHVATKVTVNVSGQELDQPDYYDQVVAALADSGLPADRLVLEVTESTLDADSAAALDVLRRLRALGIRIAIDDFGTGYSSLSRLHRLPADILKIDRSFVAVLGPTDQEAPVIAAITALARTLGLRTVAEGVEEPHQAALLRRYGCDEIQGWLYGRPGDPELIGAALAGPRTPNHLLTGNR
ncbi:putative bifunctional diguanylate cyclase/phosphodiesterase [Cryptosporangium aurantiacum]|uniref:Diguanylate cyclase/phosphodiesterase n=1 Tax=Cryptosporangium aurantiacum TaxID=134849 RepID=A0A1M7TUB4_9ACTN|nr:GGDEF domain-containing phosphodiesterase [Cryptosporangium aurantiacum]SHN74295.1 diguanylate cyclase/phosphodiesterase [Cryptosporangium aurantiacum]